MTPFEYIFNNDYQALVSYLENGNPNVVDEKGRTLLDYTIIFHNNDMFSLLLKSYVDLNIKDNIGNTCYHYAVINNRIGYLKTLLNESGNIKTRNNFGQTPFYLACLYGRLEMVLLFLEYQDIDMDEVNDQDECIFHALVRSRNLELIYKLGGYKDYIEKRNCFGQTPLAIAVKQNSLDVVKFLLLNNAFVNTKDNFLETPLFSSYVNENKEITNLLLQHGAILDCKDKLIETIFDKKVSSNFKAYVEDKILLNQCRKYEKTYPLHYAIYINNYNKIISNLSIKNLNRKDKYGYTPYDIANYYKDYDLCKLLNSKIKEFSKLI